MIIVAGKKVVRRRLGWVGEFCPICRALECVEVKRLSQVSHLYYIPLGKGKVIAYELTCRGCESLFGTQSVSYTTYGRRPDADVVKVIGETNPESVERHSERLDLEDRVAHGRLTAQERAELIAEPLIALNFMTTRKVGKGMIPTGAGFCIVFLVFLVPAAIVAWTAPRTPLEVRAALSAIVAALAVGAYIGFRRGGRGWIRRNLLPRLARSLAPLRPTFEELEAVLLGLARQGLIIGRRVETKDLFAAIESARVAPATP